LANNLTNLFDQYGLGKKIAYVKDEGSNLNARTTTLKSIMKCEVIGLNENFKAFILAMVI
jgi:hypothetical protein